jgi:hypothetical protein
MIVPHRGPYALEGFRSLRAGGLHDLERVQAPGVGTHHARRWMAVKQGPNAVNAGSGVATVRRLGAVASDAGAVLIARAGRYRSVVGRGHSIVGSPCFSCKK